MSLPVVVLAGGLSTRLRPLTDRLPKVLIDVAGKPFAVHQLELLRRHGLTQIVMCVGHFGGMVEAALGDGRRWGVQLRYVRDGPTLLGTGGAVRKSLSLVGDAFFVLYGDAYLECDYAAVERAFLLGGALGLMTVFRNVNQWDRSNVLFRNGRIERYDKNAHTPTMQHIDYGLGVLRAQALDGYPPDAVLDLAEVYRDLLFRGQLQGFEVTHRFYEIGSPSGLRETQEYLLLRSASRQGPDA